MSVMADLAEMARNRARNEEEKPLRDLRERLIRGRDELERLKKGIQPGHPDRNRLHGKIEGVNLSISYIEESLR